MACRHTAIPPLPFRRSVNPHLGFEIFRLSELYERADRKVLEHALEAPRRLEFHIIHVGLRGRGTMGIDFAPVPLGAAKDDPAAVKATRDYIEAFDAAVASSKTSAEVQQKLKAKYGAYQLDIILQLAADAAIPPKK